MKANPPSRRAAVATAVVATLLPAAVARAGPFVSGNDLVVVRVGAGGTTAYPTGSAPVPVFLDEYDVSGAAAVLKNSVALPTAGAAAFTLPATSDHDGQISRSVDGRYLVLGGYREDVGSAAALHTNAALPGNIARVIARVGAGGVPDTTTALAGAGDYKNSSIRSVASVDGGQFWTAGNDITKPPTAGADAGGVRYAPYGAAGAQGLNNGFSYDARTVGIYNGQLYGASSSSNSPTGPAAGGASANGKDVFSISTDAAHGGGLPTPGGAVTFASLTNVGSQSPVFLDLTGSIPGVDTAYVANSAGSVDKYALIGQAWTFKGSVALAGIENLTASVNGTAVTLYGGAYSGAGGGVFRTVDATGYDVAPTATFGAAYIPLPDANTQFRGVAFAAVPEPSSATVVLLTAATMTMSRRRRRRRA